MLKTKESLEEVYKAAAQRRDEHFQNHRVDVKYRPEEFYIALIAFPEHFSRGGFGPEGITATGRTPVDAVGALWQWLYLQFVFDVTNERKGGQ